MLVQNVCAVCTRIMPQHDRQLLALCSASAAVACASEECQQSWHAVSMHVASRGLC